MFGLFFSGKVKLFFFVISIQRVICVLQFHMLVYETAAGGICVKSVYGIL